MLQGVQRCRCALPFLPKAWFMRLADSPLAVPWQMSRCHWGEHTYLSRYICIYLIYTYTDLSRLAATRSLQEYRISLLVEAYHCSRRRTHHSLRKQDRYVRKTRARLCSVGSALQGLRANTRFAAPASPRPGSRAYLELLSRKVFLLATVPLSCGSQLTMSRLDLLRSISALFV